MEESRDRISELPVPILHRVLWFLPREDSVRASVLSKQWNFVRKSFPRLIFTEPRDMVETGTPEYRQRHGEYLEYVDAFLRNFVRYKLCIEEMVLYLRFMDLEFAPLVDSWLPIALHNGVSDLKFNVTLDDETGEFFEYPLLQTAFSVYALLLNGRVGFSCLRKLSLRDVVLCEDIVRDINRNCPNLSDLELWHVSGLKTFNVSKLNRLVSFEIRFGYELSAVFVDAPSLDRFTFGLEAPCAPRGVFGLTSCRYLRKLELRHLAIDDTLLRLHVSRFPLLEDLDISLCHRLRRIKISLQRLKNLALLSCRAIEAVEIDAPILSEFSFTLGGAEFPDVVTRGIVPCSVDFGYNMHFTDGQVDSRWFLAMREYLARLPFEDITFGALSNHDPVHFDPDETSFDVEELRGAVIPRVVGVDLNLNGLEIAPSSCWATVLKGLFWTCHPRKIYMQLTADSSDEDNGIKVFCGMVLESKCLKAAKVVSIAGVPLNVESVGGIEHEQFRHVLDTLSLIPYNIIVFELEWDDSAMHGSTVL